MNNRNFSFDLLRALATVSVVALHVAGPVLYEYGSLPAGEWWTANAIDSAVRFSVPIFLMLTGALLLPRMEPAGQFLKRRFARLLWPFIFWSAVYLGVATHIGNRIPIAKPGQGVDMTVGIVALQVAVVEPQHPHQPKLLLQPP